VFPPRALVLFPISLPRFLTAPRPPPRAFYSFSYPPPTTPAGPFARESTQGFLLFVLSISLPFSHVRARSPPALRGNARFVISTPRLVSSLSPTPPLCRIAREGRLIKLYRGAIYDSTIRSPHPWKHLSLAHSRRGPPTAGKGTGHPLLRCAPQHRSPFIQEGFPSTPPQLQASSDTVLPSPTYVYVYIYTYVYAYIIYIYIYIDVLDCLSKGLRY
jgi:hypothetical protein